MDKADVVRTLEEMADVLELTDANPFQIAAYRNGAQNLEDWDGELERAAVEKTLTEIPGIGKGLSAMIEDLVLRDRSDECERLRSLVPATLRELLDIPRLGPKRIRRLRSELGVESVAALEGAAKDGKVRALRGFGAKSEQQILQGIDRARRYGRVS